MLEQVINPPSLILLKPRQRDPPERPDPAPPPKRPRPPPSAPSQDARSSSSYQNDDNIQEVIPVKSEPVSHSEQNNTVAMAPRQTRPMTRQERATEWSQTTPCIETTSTETTTSTAKKRMAALTDPGWKEWPARPERLETKVSANFKKFCQNNILGLKQLDFKIFD